LACEAGSVAGELRESARINALAIAHVIYNRMTSLSYGGTAVEVVSRGSVTQNGVRVQWDCYAQGANASLGLTAQGLDSIDPSISLYAQDLVNNIQPHFPAFDPSVNYYGLYTFGIAGDPNLTATPNAIATYLAPFCNDDDLPLFIGLAPFVNGQNATAFFSSPTDCVLTVPPTSTPTP
jgi:hypothetical protein